MYKFHRKLNGVDFFAPSTVTNKKYDAYVDGKKYSFGDIRYQHYHDKIGYYKDWDHKDKIRRILYAKRHKNDNLDEFSPGYFSMFYLW